MHRSRIRLVGGWTDLSVLTAAEVELLDAGNFSAIDGDAGGTWGPTNKIIIGGQGLHVTAPLWADNLLITAGSTARVLGLVGNPGKLLMQAYSLLSVEANATAEILANAVFNVYGTQNVQPGGVLNVLSASGALPAGVVQWNQGAIANFLEGSKLLLTGDGGAGSAELISSGLAYFNGTTRYQPGSGTTVSGAVGNLARWWFEGYSETTVNGVAGKKAAWIFGAYSDVTFAAGLVTDSGTWTRTGTETWTGGGSAMVFENFAGAEWKNNSLLWIDAGCDYRQRADNKRTGADIPSGTGAYRSNRPAMGFDDDVTIHGEHQDVLFVPSGLTADRVWEIAPPPDPINTAPSFKIRQRAPGSQAHDLLVKDENSGQTLCTFAAGTGYYGSAEFQWDPFSAVWMIVGMLPDANVSHPT